MTASIAARDLRELVQKSGRYDLRDLAAYLLELVPPGCDFGFDDTSAVSSVLWTRAAPHQLLFLRLGSKAGAQMIWDLAHELGHTTLGHQPQHLRNPKHERAAWDQGWSLVSQFAPSHAAHWRDEFESRRDECLETYL